MSEGVPAASTRSSVTLVEMESELEALLVEYDSLETAWPKGRHVLVRARIGRQVADALSRIADLVNDITPESQVRQELRVAIETIADYLPRCQKQASRFNPAQIEILDAFLGGLLFEAELDGVTENNSDFVYAEFGRRVVASAKHYQAMVNAAREDKVES